MTIDLAAADLAAFEDYERAVLPLLDEHGARLEHACRSVDGRTETHLLFFPGADAFEAYLADPRRAALQSTWVATGAGSTVADVVPVDYSER